VRPQIKETSAPNSRPERTIPPTPEISLVDLTEEDTVPYSNNDTNNHSTEDDEIQIIREIPLAPVNDAIGDDPSLESLISYTPPLELEPLDPETEYRQEINNIFFNLDQYARAVFGVPLSL